MLKNIQKKSNFGRQDIGPMKALFFLFTLLSSVTVIAQIKTSENRIEIELKDGYNSEKVYEFGRNGFVMTSQSDKPVDGAIEYRFQRYSTDLTFTDEYLFSWPKGFVETKSFIEGDVLYKLIMNRFGKYSILQYNIKTGGLTQMDGDLEHSISVQFFEVANGHALLAGYYQRKWSITNIDLTSGTMNTNDILVEGIKAKRVGVSNLQYVEKSQSFYVSIAGNISRKTTKWYLYQYNLAGDFVRAMPMNEEIDKQLKSTTIAGLDKKDILISGTYSTYGGSSSTGLYMTTTVDGELQAANFYNYIDLENFLSYLPERTQARIEKKKERMAGRGKELEISYNMAIHDIIPCGNDYLFLGEAYYPTYRTETRTTYVNGRPTTTTVQVFDGYQYTHALIAKFNKKGELLWSQCFKMYPFTKPYYVKRFIRIADQTQKSIKLVFADGNYIYGKEFDFDGVMISDKTSTQINGSSENDNVRVAASEVSYWYENYFLSYGFQQIKNTKDEDVKRKRTVFFVNKIKFE